MPFKTGTLTIGELVFFVLGALVILFGEKLKLDAKMKVYVGLLVILIGQILF